MRKRHEGGVRGGRALVQSHDALLAFDGCGFHMCEREGHRRGLRVGRHGRAGRRHAWSERHGSRRRGGYPLGFAEKGGRGFACERHDVCREDTTAPPLAHATRLMARRRRPNGGAVAEAPKNMRFSEAQRWRARGAQRGTRRKAGGSEDDHRCSDLRIRTRTGVACSQRACVSSLRCRGRGPQEWRCWPLQPREAQRTQVRNAKRQFPSEFQMSPECLRHRQDE
mmetsp:Transcript_115397/g.326139  ORF Transcript_115397/g.326139 Transcript_115397/m.326139 type:complete len:224 (+) Transcript_115397:579-1250(+)